MTAIHGRDAATSYDAWVGALEAAGGLQPLSAEVVDIALAAGRVSAQAVVARRPSPGFDAAAMDGIAVSATTTAAAPVTLVAPAFSHVDTGDPLPPGTDAVVRSEDVVVGDGVTLAHEVAPYTNVRQVGEDVAAGDLLVRAGRRLGAADLAVVASAGEATIAVLRRPVVAIVPSGDELVEPGRDPRAGEIVETNSLMLGAMVEQSGCVARRGPIVPDDPELLTAALEQAAADADLVLLVAGSAKGAGDHAAEVIERSGRVVVRGVAVRPGHPVVLGLTGSTPMIGVPGYPVSAAIAFELFAAPLLAALAGGRATRRPRARATARLEIRSTARSDEWVRVRLGRIGRDLVALPLRRGAGVLSSLAHADGLACIPLGTGGVAEGDEIEVELLRPLEAIERTLLVAGSTDPSLDRLAASTDLHADADGSENGAAALAAGRCHAALLVAEDVPAGAVSLGAWERQLGLIVAPGNPLGVEGTDALGRPDVRIANRPPGSSSRRLLDDLLAEASIDPGSVRGYAREARSHAAAAAAVAAGLADCAVAAGAAAASRSLGFVPLVTQRLTLAADRSLEHDDRVVSLRAFLDSPSWHHTLEALGYRWHT
jgi:putative molybdopterin biosynthesis protein